MSKAFDCLNHHLLLGKLEAYCFDTNGIRLMSSYFKDRFNRLGETTSSWKCVKRGCPQGSSFGPLLWNLFQNDLTFCYKVIAMLRRQYHIILTASWEKIYSALGGVAKRRSVIRNIFFPNAFNIMWYCRLKIAISFVSRCIIYRDK